MLKRKSCFVCAFIADKWSCFVCPVPYLFSITPALGHAFVNRSAVVSGQNMGNGSDILSVKLCSYFETTIVRQNASVVEIVVPPSGSLTGMMCDVTVTAVHAGVSVLPQSFWFPPRTLLLFFRALSSCLSPSLCFFSPSLSVCAIHSFIFACSEP